MEVMDQIEIKPFAPESTDQVIQLWEECGLTRPWNNPEKDIQRKLLQNPELFFLAWKMRSSRVPAWQDMTVTGDGYTISG